MIPSVTAITDGRTTVVGNTAIRVDDNGGSNSGSGGGGSNDDGGCSGKGSNVSGKDRVCGTTTRTVGQKVTTTGIGDVILRGRYYLVEEQEYVPLIAVTARFKFPTANASQGLGTGGFDHGYGVEVFKLIGTSWLVFFDGGYNFIGDPDRVGLTVFGVFGSFTYYLPELFPTRLRATGAGFTYNIGRLIAAFGPFLVGSIAAAGANALESAMYLLFWVGFVPVVGLLLLPLVIETKGKVLAD